MIDLTPMASTLPDGFGIYLLYARAIQQIHDHFFLLSSTCSASVQ